MKASFYEYLLPFLAILVASFVFLMGLAYWNGATDAESSCITSSGERC